MALIVTGSIAIDSVQAPTGSVTDVMGGSCIYFAAGASFFEPVRVVAAVGEDCPDSFLDEFKNFDIDLEGLERRAGSKTFRWSGKYLDDMNQRETLDVQLNVLGEALPPVPESYRDSKYLFLACTSPGNQIELLNAFPNRQLVIADTIELYIEAEREGLLEVLRQIDGVVFNDSEARMLTEQRDTIEAAYAMIDMGLKFAIIKKGEHGALLCHPDGLVGLPAFPSRKVVDPTGAGDSFAGGMIGYLASQGGDTSLTTMKKAIAYGTTVASYTIESFSVERLKQINRAEVDQRFEQYRDMLKLD